MVDTIYGSFPKAPAFLPPRISVSVETGVSGIETGFIALVGLNRERVINSQTKIYIPQILYHRGNIAYRYHRNGICSVRNRRYLDKN